MLMSNMCSNIEEVMSEISDQWMDINGVVGISQGKIDEQDCIIVGVNIKTPEIEENIPQKYKGFNVKVEEWGHIFAQKQQ